jgi:pre-mRNA-splicing factor SYF1
VYDRYVKFNPLAKEDYIEFLLESDDLESALLVYRDILDDEGFISQKDKSEFQIWLEFCEFISKNPDRVPKELNSPVILKQAIARYQDEAGKLWIMLADFHTRSGNWA